MSQALHPESTAATPMAAPTEALIETFAKRLNLPGELGNPLRGYERTSVAGRKSQWDVAAGLALRDAGE